MARATRGKSKGVPSLDVMKSSYRNARDTGDKEEEARWANQIGHAFKDRGEYVKALQWFRKDYEISSSGSGAVDPVKLMPTCQSIGEVYLRLQNYDDALAYQRKHFHWAEQAGDLVEQQRASTQLGRTYLELYEIKGRLSGLPDAKAYFGTSLELAQRLRANLPASHSSPSRFVIEHVDAYNNLGLVRALAEDHKQALKFYSAGLKLCDEEEIDANDAARSRIHHNLGRLYADQRSWEKAKHHTELDIEICQKIPHAQGEAKGLMNLADLYFKSQDYDQTTRCYKRALHIAQSLEDEDALCSQIKSNIEIVGQARATSKAFDADMQKLSKLRRDVESSKGTGAERKYIKQECALLLDLTARAEELQSWEVHLGLAKRLKRLSKELADSEKLGDALEIVASSYYNLRNFQKAIKWHLRSLDLCKRIGHLEGQIVAKINYGNTLDSSGNSEAALKVYQEALEAAKTCGGVKMLPQQISALDNIHYCYFIRLERLDEARKVEFELKQLKYATSGDQDQQDEDERCSETGSEGSREDSALPAASLCVSEEDSSVDGLAEREKDFNVQSRRSKLASNSDESDDDNAPLASIKPQIRNRRLSQRISIPPQRKGNKISRLVPVTHNRVQERDVAQGSQLSGREVLGNLRDRRKRVVSDDGSSEGSMEIELGRRQESKSARGSPNAVPALDITVRSGDKVATRSKGNLGSSSARHHDATEHPVSLSSDDDDLLPVSRKRHKFVNNSSSWSADNLRSPRHKREAARPGVNNDLTAPSVGYLRKRHKSDINSSSRPSSWSTDNLRSPLQNVEAAPPDVNNDLTAPSDGCFNFQNVNISELGSKDSDGLPRGKPVEAAIHANTSGPKDEESFGRVATRISSPVADKGAALARTTGDLNDPAVTRIHPNCAQGWTNTSLLESYLSHCSASTKSMCPNSLLVEKLRSQKVSEEVVVAGCSLEDNDARPLLAALRDSDAFSLLDMSHNLLGNSTVHAIQELIKTTDQEGLGLTLDLHCNKLGAGALLEICRCPVSLSRLEVLNLSGNRLTDAAARHLSTILKSQALATLNLESCALTTRAITQLTSALHRGSPLNKLCIGNNAPVASHAIQELLQQLSTLQWFSHLDLKGLELDGAAVACLCAFLEKSKSITTLILRNTEIRNDGALAIADALSNPSHCLEKLDLSLNGFDKDPAATLCTRVMSLQKVSDLNLSGNNLGEKAVEALAQSLAQVNCRLKVLDLSKCHLGPSGVLLIMQSLTEQASLLDLNLAENIEGVQFQLPPPNASPSTCASVEGSKGQLQNPSVENVSKTIKIQESTRDHRSAQTQLAGEVAAGLAGEITGEPADDVAADPAREKGVDQARGPEGDLAGKVAGEPQELAGARSTDVDSRAQQGEQGTEENVPSHCYQPNSTNFSDGNPEATLRWTNDATEGIQVYVSLDPTEPGRAAADEIPTASFCEEEVRKLEPHDSSTKNVQPIVTDPLQLDSCYHKTGSVSLLETKSSGLDVRSTNCSWVPTTVHVFLEQFSTSVRKAKGLQRLDVSNNTIDGSGINALFLAWSACPRGSSDHEQHVDGTVVHFSVKARPCPCADSPCCASQ